MGCCDKNFIWNHLSHTAPLPCSVVLASRVLSITGSAISFPLGTPPEGKTLSGQYSTGWDTTDADALDTALTELGQKIDPPWYSVRQAGRHANDRRSENRSALRGASSMRRYWKAIAVSATWVAGCSVADHYGNAFARGWRKSGCARMTAAGSRRCAGLHSGWCRGRARREDRGRRDSGWRFIVIEGSRFRGAERARQ